ncbi:MAG: sterol desaturase family protein [Pseudomonadota bacterium]
MPPVPDNHYVAADQPLALAVKYALQPLLVIAALGVWLLDPAYPATFVLVIVGVQVILGSFEHLIPARPGWLIRGWEKIVNIVLVIVLSSGTVVIADWYNQVMAAPLAELRSSLHLDIWPHHWPLLAQMFMVFFLSEFIWYWVHRAEHRWPLVWRLSGHGAHHSFKRLGALNFGLNHPLELFLLVLPAALVELTFGVGVAVVGAAILTTTQASIAHANLDLNSRVIGWLFTTNTHHLRHHSAVLDESNTNYGCSAIVWDRLFGTFADSRSLEAGIGPTEPSLWAKFLMPVREPRDSQVAPGN